jgi:hypothetical protein
MLYFKFFSGDIIPLSYNNDDNDNNDNNADILKKWNNIIQSLSKIIDYDPKTIIILNHDNTDPPPIIENNIYDIFIRDINDFNELFISVSNHLSDTYDISIYRKNNKDNKLIQHIIMSQNDINYPNNPLIFLNKNITIPWYDRQEIIDRIMIQMTQISYIIDFN